MLRYPVILKLCDNKKMSVRFLDVPSAVTYGSDAADALHNAAGALQTAFMTYIQDRRPIPYPSPYRKKKWLVTLPVLSQAKIALYRAMFAAGVGKADLARRLGAHMPQVDRLLDLSHASKIEQIEAALRAVGKELTIKVLDVA